MKKIICLLVCVMVVMSFTACGKKNDTPKSSSDIKQSESVKTEDKKADVSSDKKKDIADNDKENVESETEVLPPATAEELEGMVDEFNTTEDPERKEELRKELEEILKQAEAMAQNQ